MRSLSRKCRLIALLLALALCCLRAAPISAVSQASTGNHPVQMVGNVALSPDGGTLAWTSPGATGTALHLGQVTGSRLTKDHMIGRGGGGGCSDTAPVWSPDGRTLAYTSDCPEVARPGDKQIMLWSPSTGQSKIFTHVTGRFARATWSPDGRTLAFLLIENATRDASALEPIKPWAGVIGEEAMEIQGVYGIDVATGHGRWLVAPTPATYVHDYSWSPNSREIAYVGSAAPGDNNWWIAKLFAQPVGGGPARLVVDPVTTSGPLHGLQIAVPSFSPDGSRIAFIGGLMSDEGSNGGDIFVANAWGGVATDVTPRIGGTPTIAAWSGNGTLRFVEDRRGHTLLDSVDVATRRPVRGALVDLGELWPGGGAFKTAIFGSARLAENPSMTAAFKAAGPAKADEVYLQRAGAAPVQLTRLNDELRPALKTVSVEWENEGFHLQGWLTFPAGYEPAKHYPVIVVAHGGPSASVFPRWGATEFAQHGYFQFEPNPRGSYGEGEASAQANRKDFGYGDLRDVLAGLDAVEARYPIDRHREGLTGMSYGGFLTMFAVTQTHRFAAAFVEAGISDWQSYYGENSIDQWMVPFFGATVYDDPAVYAKSSPITFVRNARTPTLIVVGDRDGECPPGQSFEFWHALRALGVKTQLVVYPNEGHRLSDPAHLADLDRRQLAWFADNMPAR